MRSPSTLRRSSFTTHLFQIRRAIASQHCHRLTYYQASENGVNTLANLVPTQDVRGWFCDHASHRPDVSFGPWIPKSRNIGGADLLAATGCGQRMLETGHPASDPPMP